MTIFLLTARTARMSTMTMTARAVFSRACLISTKAVGVTSSRSATTTAATASFQRTSSSRSRGQLVTTAMGLMGGGAASIVHPIVVTFCEKKKNNDDDSILSRDENGNINWNAVLDNVATLTGEKVQAAVDTGVPTQLSYGFISGYCSGIALKKVGKAAAVVLGLGFMSLQTLSYYGYINVDHVAIQKDVENMMDLNKDGKVDVKDGKIAQEKVMEILQFGLPGGGGFAAGFVSGIRSG